MNRKVFLIDSNNKKMKWRSTAWTRIALIPLIDTYVLLLGISIILFLLNEYKIANLYIEGKDFVTYILMVVAYIAISIIIGIFDLIRFLSLNNTIVVKENNNITIIKALKDTTGTSKIAIGSMFYNTSDSLLQSLASLGLYASGAVEMQKNLSKRDKKIIVEINRILDERSNDYKYTDYKNCKLISETKNYYKYIGEKNGIPSTFKIHKIYSNINLLTKEEN